MSNKRPKAKKTAVAKAAIQRSGTLPASTHSWKPWWGPATLLVLTLAMFGDVLFQNDRVLSQLGTDLSSQFLGWRTFGFGQLRNGNLPLWNPYLFSGMPYLGEFQSGMLYPPNMLHLVMPVGQAVNILVAFHVFIGGLFMYYWASRRGLHWIAATMSGALLMFCGAQSLHIYAGHLPNLYTMAWTPLLLLAVDGIFESKTLQWCLVGIAALAMQILAGHPQYVFHTSVATIAYGCLRLATAKRRGPAAAALVAVWIGAAALSAAQLWTGLDASAESVRGKGVPYEFAAMFSFPPENLVTLAVPGFFGDMIHSTYWGRCYLWEVSLFVGVMGLVLAIYGATRGESRRSLYSLPMALVLLTLALGSHTPLFHALYEYVPGFDKFRGNSKFIFQASLFIAMLSGVGLDRLLRFQQRDVRLCMAVGGCALAAAGAGFALRPGMWGFASRCWEWVMNAMMTTGESYVPPSVMSDPSFARQAGTSASWAILTAAATLIVLACLLLAGSYSRAATYAIALAAVAEVFVFARSARQTFALEEARSPQVEQLLAANPGDYRVLNLANPNAALSTGVGDLWGYDPGVSLRYAQFMAFTQKENPDTVTQYINFKESNRLYRMLRLRYIFVPQQQGLVVQEEKDPLPRLSLVYHHAVLTSRDEIFAAMARDSFDPSREVILETQPKGPPAPSSAGQPGTAAVVASTTDELTIRADLPSPGILLITDGYSRDWRALALPGSAQARYQVMPANYVLMAVPLSAGHHLFRLEYAPRAFQIGKWLSLASFGIFLAACAWARTRQ